MDHGLRDAPDLAPLKTPDAHAGAALGCGIEEDNWVEHDVHDHVTFAGRGNQHRDCVLPIFMPVHQEGVGI